MENIYDQLQAQEDASIAQTKRDNLVTATERKKQHQLDLNAPVSESWDNHQQNLADANMTPTERYNKAMGIDSSDTSTGLIDAAQSSMYQTGGNLFDLGVDVYDRVKLEIDPASEPTTKNAYWDSLSETEVADKEAGFDRSEYTADNKKLMSQLDKGDIAGGAFTAIGMGPTALALSAGAFTEFAASAAIMPEVAIPKYLASIGTKLPVVAKVLSHIWKTAPSAAIYAADATNQSATKYKEATEEDKPLWEIGRDFVGYTVLGTMEVPIIKGIAKDMTAGAFKSMVKDAVQVLKPTAELKKTIANSFIRNLGVVLENSGKEAMQEYFETWYGIYAEDDKDFADQLANKAHHTEALAGAFVGAAAGGTPSAVTRGAGQLVTAPALATRGALDIAGRYGTKRLDQWSMAALNADDRAVLQSEYENTAAGFEEDNAKHTASIDVVGKAKTEQDLLNLNDTGITTAINNYKSTNKIVEPNVFEGLRKRYYDSVFSSVVDIDTQLKEAKSINTATMEPSAKTAHETSVSELKTKLSELKKLGVTIAKSKDIHSLNRVQVPGMQEEISSILSNSPSAPLTSGEVKTLKADAISRSKAALFSNKTELEYSRAKLGALKVAGNIKTGTLSILKQYGITEESIKNAGVVLKDKYNNVLDGAKNLDSTAAAGLAHIIADSGEDIKADTIEAVANNLTDVDLDTLIKTTKEKKFTTAYDTLVKIKSAKDSAKSKYNLTRDTFIKSFDEGTLLSKLNDNIVKGVVSTIGAKEAVQLQAELMATTSGKLHGDKVFTTVDAAYKLLEESGYTGAPILRKIKAGIAKARETDKSFIETASEKTANLWNKVVNSKTFTDTTTLAKDLSNEVFTALSNAVDGTGLNTVDLNDLEAKIGSMTKDELADTAYAIVNSQSTYNKEAVLNTPAVKAFVEAHPTEIQDAMNRTTEKLAKSDESKALTPTELINASVLSTKQVRDTARAMVYDTDGHSNDTIDSPQVRKFANNPSYYSIVDEEYDLYTQDTKGAYDKEDTPAKSTIAEIKKLVTSNNKKFSYDVRQTIRKLVEGGYSEDIANSQEVVELKKLYKSIYDKELKRANNEDIAPVSTVKVHEVEKTTKNEAKALSLDEVVKALDDNSGLTEEQVRAVAQSIAYQNEQLGYSGTAVMDTGIDDKLINSAYYSTFDNELDRITKEYEGSYEKADEPAVDALAEIKELVQTKELSSMVRKTMRKLVNEEYPQDILESSTAKALIIKYPELHSQEVRRTDGIDINKEFEASTKNEDDKIQEDIISKELRIDSIKTSKEKLTETRIAELKAMLNASGVKITC